MPSGHVRAPCQIMHLENQVQSTLIDLVTLDGCDDGPVHLPAGTPVTLRFGSSRPHHAREFAAIMAHWEELAAVVDLTIDTTPDGLHCRFIADEIELIVVAGPPTSGTPQG
jgi:hypothetical protein